MLELMWLLLAECSREGRRRSGKKCHFGLTLFGSPDLDHCRQSKISKAFDYLRVGYDEGRLNHLPSCRPYDASLLILSSGLRDIVFLRHFLHHVYFGTPYRCLQTHRSLSGCRGNSSSESTATLRAHVSSARRWKSQS